jgi:hypothetical protein
LKQSFASVKHVEKILFTKVYKHEKIWGEPFNFVQKLCLNTNTNQNNSLNLVPTHFASLLSLTSLKKSFASVKHVETEIVCTRVSSITRFRNKYIQVMTVD